MRITESRLRSIIRSVIRESIGGVNKVSGETDVEQLAYGISSLIEIACDDESSNESISSLLNSYSEQKGENGFEFTLDEFNKLKGLCHKHGYDSSGLYDDWGSYRTFKKEVLTSLGFTQNDFEILLSLNREHNAVEDSDYWLPYVDESEDKSELEFYLEF